MCRKKNYSRGFKSLRYREVPAGVWGLRLNQDSLHQNHCAKNKREERHDTLTEVNHFPPFIFEYHTFRALKPLVHSQINNYLNFTCLNFVGCILC